MKSLAHHVRRHYHERYIKPHGPRAHFVLLFDAILVAIILVLLGTASYFAFFYKPIRDDFRFEVITNGPLVAGRRASVIMRISNIGRMHLHGIQLDTSLPPEFVITDWPAGYDAAKHLISVGDIGPHGKIEMSLGGTLYGPPKTETVFVHMMASDQNGAPDEKIFSVPIHWDENLVKGSLAFPAEIVANQTFPVRFTVTNGTVQRFDDVHVVPHWPANFHVLASTPPMEKGAFDIGSLEPGASATVEVFGRYVGHAEDFAASIETFWIDNGTQVLIDRTEIRRSSVDVNLSLHASFTDGKTVYVPGDAVPVQIVYRNDSPYALEDVRLSIPLNPNLFDAKTPNLVFNPIREIAAGATGTVMAITHLKTMISPYVVNPKISLVPTATFSIIDPTLTDAIVTGTGMQANISGTAKLVLAARYYTTEGDQIGRGPLPPKVGKETRYWIFASVTVGSNDLVDGRVEIPLPNGVSWTGKQAVSAGSPLVAYEAKTATLVWNLGDLPAHTGVNSDVPTASFEVVLVPEAAGVALPLASSASFQAKDVSTGASVSSAAGAVTTRLTGDPYAQGKGIIRP